MAWISRLSFIAALRWALLWPATIVVLVLLTVAGLWAYHAYIIAGTSDTIFMSFRLGPRLRLLTVLFLPPVAFLGLWWIARR